MAPERIQLRRTKGWRLPPNTVKVDRSTIWGNPFRVGERFYVDGRIGPGEWFDGSPEGVVKAFREWTTQHVDYWASITRVLRGKNLACWCKPGAACHADVLLEIANR